MNSLEKGLYREIIKRSLVKEKDLEEAVSRSKSESLPFSEYLHISQLVTEQDVLAILSDLSKIPYCDLKEIFIEEFAIRSVPVKVAWHYKFLPVSLDDNSMKIAVNKPLSIREQDELRLSLGYDINMVLARKSQILDMLKTYYGIAADTVDRMIKGSSSHGAGASSQTMYDQIDDLEKMAEDASVIKLVNQIILEAFRKRATDIHIEPHRGELVLRYRVDGKLRQQPVPDDFNRFLAPILSRVKIMANLNIVERRVPQDGRAIVRIQDQVLDLRVSFMPTPHGESVVIRILPSKRHLSLEELGLSPEGTLRFESILHKTNGIVFVTGPTGSGKTTSLYACIEKINTKDRKILTIEDPIEYEIEGVTQIQVSQMVGLTFANGLRSMLRQDPDVMMVGEVRDKETAEIAIRIALTGHLVLSTLHTNDAASGVTRLFDVGIQPYLVASTVRAFIAQRLVRVICPECKVEDKDVADKYKDHIAKISGAVDASGIKVFKGRGCEKCEKTGFYGRTAIYEILIVDNVIREMIIGKRSSHDIRTQALRTGMKTLQYDGWLKVGRGITTPDEVLKVARDIDSFDISETEDVPDA